MFILAEALYQFSPLDVYYWTGLKKVMAGVESGRSSFLMGKYSITGWFYYFFVAFFLKTPIPFLLLLAATAFLKPLWQKDRMLYILWPAAFYFALSCYSKVNIGHRHIMPVYPFLILWVSGIYPLIKNNWQKLLFGALLCLYALCAVKTSPWHLSYFNEFIKSPDEGYKYMTDSNLDWGQGLKELSKYLKEQGIDSIYFCYFGVGDPHYYGIRYRPFGFIDNISYPKTSFREGDSIDFSKQKKVLFAISATNLQATYYADKNAFAAFKEIEPEKIIAHSIFVYDLSKNPKQYEVLKQMSGEK